MSVAFYFNIFLVSGQICLKFIRSLFVIKHSGLFVQKKCIGSHRTGMYGRSGVGHANVRNGTSQEVVFLPTGSIILFQRAFAAVGKK